MNRWSVRNVLIYKRGNYQEANNEEEHTIQWTKKRNKKDQQ